MVGLRLIPPVGAPIVIGQDVSVVGREPGCEVFVNDGSVSRRHARIERRGAAYFVVDEGSANGTFLDSQRVADALLRPGQEVRFGAVPFRVEIAGAAGPGDRRDDPGRRAHGAAAAAAPGRPRATAGRVPAAAARGRRPAGVSAGSAAPGVHAQRPAASPAHARTRARRARAAAGRRRRSAAGRARALGTQRVVLGRHRLRRPAADRPAHRGRHRLRRVQGRASGPGPARGGEGAPRRREGGQPGRGLRAPGPGLPDRGLEGGVPGVRRQARVVRAARRLHVLRASTSRTTPRPWPARCGRDRRRPGGRVLQADPRRARPGRSPTSRSEASARRTRSPTRAPV